MVGGCPSDEFCCPVCCHCYGKLCVEDFGEFGSRAECEQGCEGGKCYYNYQTGCWDCVKNEIVVHEPPYDPEKIQEITTEEHERAAGLAEVERLFNEALLEVPTLGDYIGNERVNIIVQDEGSYYLLIEDKEIYQSGGGNIEDPTVQVITDVSTLDEINEGVLNPLDAYKEGRVKIEGVGFVNGIKYWFAEFMVDNFAPVDAVPNLEPPEEPEEPETQVDAEIDEQKAPIVPEGGEFPEGEIPESVLVVEMEMGSEIYVDGTEVYNG